jgi:hypothetical protein
LAEVNLKAFLQQTRQAFFDGDLEALSKYFIWPLVVYSPAGVLVVKDQAQFLIVSGQYLAARRICNRKQHLRHSQTRTHLQSSHAGDRALDRTDRRWIAGCDQHNPLFSFDNLRRSLADRDDGIPRNSNPDRNGRAHYSLNSCAEPPISVPEPLAQLNTILSRI